MVDGIASTSVQVSSVAVSSASSDYCCNDPGCNCKGGREAKKALDTRREQAELDQVSVSAAGLAALRAEAAPSAIAAPTSTNAPLTVTAVPPPSPTEFAPPPRNTTETTQVAALAERPAEPPSPSSANSPINAYLSNARDAELANKRIDAQERIDTYA